MSFCRWSNLSDVYAYEAENEFHLHVKGDDKTYILGDAEGLYDKLVQLKNEGFRVPDYVLTCLVDEYFPW